MRTADALLLLTLAALLAACTAEEPAPSDATPPPATEPAAGTETGGPAGEVAPESRAPAGADSPAVEKPAMPEGLDAEWAPYFAHIPFVFGGEAGAAKAAETGKPMMMFYAATW